MGRYEAPQVRPSGDLIRLVDVAPGIEVIESNESYHSDIWITMRCRPAVGLEAIPWAYDKIIDDVNQLDLSQLIVKSPTGGR